MKKEIIYCNRYNDKIKFIQISLKIIHMSGYTPYYRAGWSNDYNDAYLAYLKDQQGIDENPLFLEEFIEKIHKEDWWDSNENFLHKYLKLIKSDKNKINMFDPSGGPYITLGTDLSKFWGDNIPRIVEKIEFINKNNKVKFTIK